MIVLLDLEWIEDNKKHLTQLSAIRTDAKWQEIESLFELVDPGPILHSNCNHMALGGYSVALFSNGTSAKECMEDFALWMKHDDVIIVWAKSNKRYLEELWATYLDSPTPVIHSVAKPVRRLVSQMKCSARSPYAILPYFGETAPFPEHRASNDVDVMRRLFVRIEFSLNQFGSQQQPAVTPKSQLSQRERNQRVVDRSQYNYIYLKDSAVFHRRECKVCLNASSHTKILGSVYYAPAARGRRPCKLCKPIPLPLDGKAFNGQEKASGTAPPVNPKEIIHAKMLTGDIIPIRRGRIVGWCHHSLHPGAVNRAIMDQHDCLGKGCPFLKKNKQSPFWTDYEAQKLAKKKRKNKRREEKLRKTGEDQQLQKLAETWRSYIEELDYDMQIVRVSEDSPNTYRVFYVSDNPFADGDRFPGFLETLRQRHPLFRIILRHIRDVDGHYVTRDEYMQRRR